jgi:hypothetical protein
MGRSGKPSPLSRLGEIASPGSNVCSIVDRPCDKVKPAPALRVGEISRSSGKVKIVSGLPHERPKVACVHEGAGRKAPNP